MSTMKHLDVICLQALELPTAASLRDVAYAVTPGGLTRDGLTASQVKSVVGRPLGLMAQFIARSAK